MKNGKISESILKRSVLKQLHTKKDNVLCKAAVGNDCAVCEDIVTSSSVVELDISNPATLSKLAVYPAVNNIATSGARPLGIDVSFLIPTTWNEAQLRELVKEIDDKCAKCGIAVLGGHTQVTRAVKNCVISITAIGKLDGSQYASSSKVQPGMDIIMTGYAGYAGTSVIVEQKPEELRTRFAQPFLDNALKYIDYLSIQSEAAVAVKSGAVAMHDVSQGGVFGALWEMASASGVGLDINLKNIPIRQETIEISEFFGINPYKLYGGGALLIAAFDGSHIVREIQKAGGNAVIIGVATDSNDRVLIQGEERRFLEIAQTDDIYLIFK